MIPDHVTTTVRGYLTFHRYPQPEGRKTSVWRVDNSKGKGIGEVRWYSQWRRYCLFPGIPSGSGPLDSTTMNTIAKFISELTKKT